MFKKISNYYNNLSIANKLKFMGISTVGLVGTIAIFFILIYQYINEQSLLEDHAETLTMVVADNIAPAVLFEDLQQIDKILFSLRHKAEVRHAYVIDASAKVLGSYHSKKEATLDQGVIARLKRSDLHFWKGLALYTMVGVHAENKQIGAIVLVTSLSGFIFQMLMEIFVLMMIVLASILLTYKFRARLRDSILKPISELNTLTGKIIETKNLRNKIPVYNEDEIGELAKNFNTMLENLEKTHMELNQQKDHFSYKAHHDALTGLPNRALFNDRLEQAITKARRHKEEFALFFIDLDHFKQINDTLGHEVGDEVLKFFAKRLNMSVRTEDTIARIGGDEFMVIMESLQTPDAISVVANKIVSIVKEPILLDEETLHLGTSIGISVYPHNGETAELLLKNADTAMYKAKNEGRDNYQFYTPQMKQMAIERKEREMQLRDAVEKEAFIIHYQPRVNLRQESSGYEAMVKWQQPEKGLVDFSTFRQLSKDIGLFFAIEQWLIKQTIEEFAQWREEGSSNKRVILNLSMKTVMNKHFSRELKTMLDAGNCPVAQVEITVSEDELSDDHEGCIMALSALNKMGIKLTITDFGVTNTSLSYLSHLPVHNVQVAHHLISSIAENAKVIKAVAALAKSMDLALMAKDIQSEGEKEFLEECGSTYMQGTLFGPTLPIQKLSQ